MLDKVNVIFTVVVLQPVGERVMVALKQCDDAFCSKDKVLLDVASACAATIQEEGHSFLANAAETDTPSVRHDPWSP
jgi:hypothetical protein